MTGNEAVTRGTHHIGLTAPNLAKTREFFLNTMGHQQVGEVSDYPAVFVSDGNIIITFGKRRIPAPSDTRYESSGNLLSGALTTTSRVEIPRPQTRNSASTAIANTSL